METNSTMELIRYSLAALQAIYKKWYRYKKAGVMVFNIVPEGQVQGSLFHNVDRPKHAEIMKTMDGINSKYGRGYNKNSGSRFRPKMEASTGKAFTVLYHEVE